MKMIVAILIAVFSLSLHAEQQVYYDYSGRLIDTPTTRTGTIPQARCISDGGQSITCKMKRIQIKLDKIDKSLDDILVGIGDCASCGIGG